MLYYIKKIVAVDNYNVTCLFNTGEVRTIDLYPIIDKYQKINDGLISALADKAFFCTVKLDSYGTLCWENGVDFDPDNLYRLSKSEIATI
ncbi:DUF2442 domain-containing protein [Dyadobacter sp. 32]|uniref:DUF2442 domain-containing protein n=1 Tax=Dyadobacter sp. 32 TaxID=538966 RepID=UPI0011ED2864